MIEELFLHVSICDPYLSYFCVLSVVFGLH